MSTSTATQYGTDCVLMLHMDGSNGGTSFPDSELNTAKTVTPYNTTTSTTTAKFGQSGYFNYASSYLDIPASTSFDPATGDFTIDFWIYFNNTGVAMYILDMGTYHNNYGVTITWNGSGNFQVYTMGGNSVLFPATVSTGNWYHVALVRHSGTLSLYFGGTSVGTPQSNSLNITTGGYDCTVANETGLPSNAFQGYIDELRIVIGTAVWTSNFTPPTAAYTAVGSGTSFDSSFICVCG